MDQYLYLDFHNWILLPMLSTSCHPLKKLQKNIFAEAALISHVIPVVRALTKVLEKQDEDIGVCSMKNKMLDLLYSKCDDIEHKKLSCVCYTIRPKI